MNRFVKQALHKLEFNCDMCSKSFSYENREEHWAICGVGIKCWLQNCNKKFDSLDALAEHWKIECPAMKVKCPQCEAKILRKDQADHNCG